MADRGSQPLQDMTKQDFAAFLERNGRFHQRVAEHLAQLVPYPEQRFDLALKSALLSAEHGTAAFVLISAGLCAPGYTLLRTQFETLVRGIWLMYAADCTWIDKLSRPLNAETAETAKDALMLNKMLRA